MITCSALFDFSTPKQEVFTLQKLNKRVRISQKSFIEIEFVEYSMDVINKQSKRNLRIEIPQRVYDTYMSGTIPEEVVLESGSGLFGW